MMSFVIFFPFFMIIFVSNIAYADYYYTGYGGIVRSVPTYHRIHNVSPYINPYIDAGAPKITYRYDPKRDVRYPKYRTVLIDDPRRPRIETLQKETYIRSPFGSRKVIINEEKRIIQSDSNQLEQQQAQSHQSKQFFPKTRRKFNHLENQEGEEENFSADRSIDRQQIRCQTRNGYSGICLSKGECYYMYGDLNYLDREQCRTNVNGRQIVGVCCPNDPDFTPNKRFDIPYALTIPRWPRINLRIDSNQLNQALKQADLDVVRFFAIEELFVGQMGQIQVAFTPASFLQQMFGPADQNQQLSNLWGFRTLQVTRALGRQLDLSPLEMRDGLSRHSLKGTPYDQYCIRSRPCDPEYRYRTIDGNCNNLVHPLWGKSLSQFNRLLPPEYSDGISELRISVTGVPLPTPRHLSVNVLRTSNSNNARFADRWNVLFMQWGQFIDHDITLGSSTRASNGAGLLCCNRTNALGPLIHPACRPIYIESNDPFYSRFNRRCNNFVRNAIGPKNNCEIGYREQSNVITAFIDGSMIYGNTYNRSRLVRSFRNGQLKTQGRNWLPFDTMNNSLACSIPQSTGNRCIFSGDVRVNQQFGLIALQLLFLREHNRLARILKELNPHWDDETLFQEARKIVGAQIQHITYNEFLPEALGRNVIRHHRISLKPNGYEFGYNYELNPSILNEFAAAAFRWHTLVQKYYRLRNDRNQDYREYEMHKIFNNPSHIYGNGALDDLIRGVLFHKSERFDSIFTEDIKNLLFAQQNQRFGLDLMAINIQRGRDHGIPTYNQIRFICGLKPFNSFREMRNSLQDRNDWQHLERTYSHVNDIDFWIGGTLERPLNEGLLGPTFSCIVGEQFRRLKYGDRFWYENGRMSHSFSERQLSEIRRATLARIICNNGDNFHRIQPLAMLPISEQNQETDCSSIPQIDLTAWISNTRSG